MQAFSSFLCASHATEVAERSISPNKITSTQSPIAKQIEIHTKLIKPQIKKNTKLRPKHTILSQIHNQNNDNKPNQFTYDQKNTVNYHRNL